MARAEHSATLTEAQREIRRIKQRKYMADYTRRKREEKLAQQKAATITRNENDQRKAPAKKGGAGYDALARARAARSANAARRREAQMEELARVSGAIQVETRVEVPSDIEAGILGVTGAPESPIEGEQMSLVPSGNGHGHHLVLPTGATLVAEIMNQFRKLAITVKESGAEFAVFNWPDGTKIAVKGDGSVAVG